MNGTYINVFRKMTDWEWYGDTNCVRVFLHLLLKANWTDSTYRGVKVPRGSVVIGRKALSEQLGISEQSVRTTIKKLVEAQSINQQVTKQFSVVSVCNFDTYNPIEKPANRQSTNNQPTTNQQVTTSKEDNKKIKDDADFFAFGVDLRTIRPTTLEGKRRTRAQLEQIAKLQSEGDTYIT